LFGQRWKNWFSLGHGCKTDAGRKKRTTSLASFLEKFREEILFHLSRPNSPESQQFIATFERIRFEFNFDILWRKDWWEWGMNQVRALILSGFVDSQGFKKVSNIHTNLGTYKYIHIYRSNLHACTCTCRCLHYTQLSTHNQACYQCEFLT
jgi:hypothetical protein